MKRRIVVLCLTMMLVMLFGACGQQSEEMQKLYDVNQVKNILQQCDALHVSYEDIEEYFSEFYISQDTYYMSFKNSRTLWTDETDWVYHVEDDAFCKDWYVMSEEEAKYLRILRRDEAEFVNSNTAKEKVAKVTKNQDGTTTIVTKKSAAESVTILRQQYGQLPEEYYSYNLEYVYVVETDTYRLLSWKQNLVKKDETILMGQWTFAYQDEQPEHMVEMAEWAKEYEEREAHIETKKELRFLYDAGTKNEEVFTFTTDTRCFVQPWLREGYEVNEDKTEKVTDDDGTVHITKYVEKIK
ncbi:MAG: hypothetical protein K5678_03115 [Acetatifactor sp.]|nr:hypothetical protein [Acetatifactor sp.]